MIEKELTDIEQTMKHLYTQYPDNSWTTPMDEEKFRQTMKQTGCNIISQLPELLNVHLSEENFIPDNGDAAVLRHIRYLPALFHTHDFFEIVYVFDGQCTNYLENSTISMQAGDLCLISPKTEHAISAVSDDCIIINLLVRASTFDTAFLDLLSGRDVLTAFFSHALYGSHKSTTLLFRTGNDTVLKDFISYAYEEYQNKAHYFQRMMNNLIHAICILLLRNHEEDIIIPSDNGTDLDENLIFIMNYIQSNYSHVTLSELAGFFHYSERHMSRLIKDNTGKCFSELVRDLKLHKAADLLGNPDLTISDIMEQIGYSDISGFYRTFKHYYGVTPVEYRRKLL